jgi:secreted trypsin-like serine protease
MRRLFLVGSLLACGAPALAMVGGAAESVGVGAGQHVVMIVGSRGTACTGVALARDLVLTAAHCVQAGADYKLVEFDAGHRPTLKSTVSVTRHPRFDMSTFLAHRATADVALIKLAEPLPSATTAAPIAAPGRPVAVGDRLTVAGYGVAVRGDGRTGGTARVAVLAVTGRPGNLQIRLVDPDTLGVRAGLGACSGDSGAPAFDATHDRLAIVGVVSWSTGPNQTDGCGGLTGVTPLSLYRDWIDETARHLGSPLARP